jgi:sterol desaturase/sphingolipid hydroxylase (fatty acid hydroxylase superfamily)
MNPVLETLSSANVRLVILILTFAALYFLESGIPFQKNNRKHFSSNFILTILVVIINFLFSGITIFLLGWAAKNNFGLLRLFNFSTAAEIAISIIFLDFWAAYLSHRIMHHVPLFWKFHSIHHSDTMIDVTSALRQHPLETIFRMFFQITGALILGVPFWLLGIYLLLSAANGQLEHANICFPEKAENFLRYFYTTPTTHKAHHSIVFKESNANYGNIFSIWDRMFGTYLLAAAPEHTRYGLDYISDDKQSDSAKDLLALALKKDKGFDRLYTKP